MRLHNLPFYGVTYQAIMKLAHRFNWHYAPPCYPEGDTLLRCQWCGFSAVVKRANYRPLISTGKQEAGQVDEQAKSARRKP